MALCMSSYFKNKYDNLYKRGSGGLGGVKRRIKVEGLVETGLGRREGGEGGRGREGGGHKIQIHFPVRNLYRWTCSQTHENFTALKLSRKHFGHCD